MTPMQFAVCGFLLAPACNILSFIMTGKAEKNILVTCCTGILTGSVGYVLGLLWNL